MKKLLLDPINMLILIVIVGYSLNVSATSSAPELGTLPQITHSNAPMIAPSPPDLTATSYMLVDVHSGKVLAEKSMNVRHPPASLTKMMTLYVINNALRAEQIHLNDKVRISRKAWRTGGSKMFIKQGQDIAVEDLIKGIAIDSGNDACVAMAEHVAGSTNSFVDLMNRQASLLGMTNTHFNDVTGLPHPDHYTTSHDLAILARALILDFPDNYVWFKQKWFRFNGIRQANRNRLLWLNPNVDGLKTGYTKAAGYCLVASAKKGSMRLLGVVLGTPSSNARTENMQRLLDYGFHFYDTDKLYQAGQMITRVTLWQGQRPQIALGLRHDLYLTLPKGALKQLKVRINVPKMIKAPLAKGQVTGQLTLQLRGKDIATRDLITLKAAPKGSKWRQIHDKVSFWIHKWFMPNSPTRANT